MYSANDQRSRSWPELLASGRLGIVLASDAVSKSFADDLRNHRTDQGSQADGCAVSRDLHATLAGTGPVVRHRRLHYLALASSNPEASDNASFIGLKCPVAANGVGQMSRSGHATGT